MDQKFRTVDCDVIAKGSWIRGDNRRPTEVWSALKIPIKTKSPLQTSPLPHEGSVTWLLLFFPFSQVFNLYIKKNKDKPDFIISVPVLHFWSKKVDPVPGDEARGGATPR